MKGFKVLMTVMAMMILSSGFMSCNSGGGSSQGDALGVNAQRGNQNSGTGGSPGNSSNSPGNSGNRGRDGDSNDHSGGSSDTSDLPVSTAVNTQQYSTATLHPGLGQFLVVWNDLRNESSFNYEAWGAYGQWVDSSGNFQGPNFPISPLGVEYRTAPHAAHDAAAGNSLVVWGTTGGDILGQVISRDGTFSGGVIPIAATSDYETVPALAFDPTQGRFLVAWLVSNPDYPIYGQLVNVDGVLEGGPFVISDVSSGKLELAASVNTQDGRFLVVWRDYRGVDLYSIRAQMINSDGTLHGGEIVIADAPGSQILPAVAFDSVNRCFLVAWSDDRRYGASAYEIYGQLVAADGVQVTSNFLISSYGGYAHAVGFDPSSANYFLAFSKYGNRIHGQYVATDGFVRDEAIPLSDLEARQGAPHVAYDTASGRFFTAWTDYRNGSIDIYGHTTQASVNQNLCDNQTALGCLACETDAGAQVDEACPTTASYANHGAYLSCVTDAVKELRRAGQIGAACALKLVDPRARSGVGNP